PRHGRLPIRHRRGLGRRAEPALCREGRGDNRRSSHGRGGPGPGGGVGRGGGGGAGAHHGFPGAERAKPAGETTGAAWRRQAEPVWGRHCGLGPPTTAAPLPAVATGLCQGRGSSLKSLSSSPGGRGLWKPLTPLVAERKTHLGSAGGGYGWKLSALFEKGMQ